MVEPERDSIKKMEPRPIEGLGWCFGLLSSEKDRGREDTLEALYETPVMKAIFRKLEEFEDFSGAVEADGPTLLFHNERGDPYGNETILTERDGRFIMHLPQLRLGILCLFGVYSSGAPGLGVSVRPTHSV